MKYFSIEELSRSATASVKKIDNTPPPETVKSLTSLVDNILDPLRESFGKPIRVTSGYRCPALNYVVSGAKNSQHMKGQAVDITGGTRAENMKLFRMIQELNLPFDQLIFERGSKADGPDWVHVSHAPKNRRQILYM